MDAGATYANFKGGTKILLPGHGRRLPCVFFVRDRGTWALGSASYERGATASQSSVANSTISGVKFSVTTNEPTSSRDVHGIQLVQGIAKGSGYYVLELLS